MLQQLRIKGIVYTKLGYTILAIYSFSFRKRKISQISEEKERRCVKMNIPASKCNFMKISGCMWWTMVINIYRYMQPDAGNWKIKIYSLLLLLRFCRVRREIKSEWEMTRKIYLMSIVSIIMAWIHKNEI